MEDIIGKKFDQLEVIKEKFLNYEENAKNYCFKKVKGKEKDQYAMVYNCIRGDEYIKITLNIIDNKNKEVKLFAQANENGDFFITDDGLVAAEFESKGKKTLFSNDLFLQCKLCEFDEKMQDYFYMLSTLFNFLGFKWDIKDGK